MSPVVGRVAPRPDSYAAAVTTGASIVRTVPARVGLVGNPSDGYGGAVLATVVPGLRATVTAERSEHIELDDGTATIDWHSLEDWRAHVRDAGHGDAHRIVSASLWALDQHVSASRGSGTSDRGVALRWSTGIPRSVGLAGSSALAVATIEATSALWGIDLDRRVVAALALSAERDVLGIAAGWQDRIVQSFGCTVLVDAARMELVDGVAVPRVRVPAARDETDVVLLVAWAAHVASPSGDYHAAVRLAADRLGPSMDALADLARRATDALERGDVDELAAGLDAGWRIRQSCAPLSADHAALVEVVRAEGVAATTPGSGGSVVALCLDAAEVDRAVRAVRQAGCVHVRVGLT
jgi:glucuronokinase